MHRIAAVLGFFFWQYPSLSVMYIWLEGPAHLSKLFHSNFKDITQAVWAHWISRALQHIFAEACIQKLDSWWNLLMTIWGSCCVPNVSSACGACYIVQMGWTINQCWKEHQTYVRLGKNDKSVITLHNWNMGHQMFSETKFLFHSASWGERLIRESLKIRHEKSPLNQEDGMDLSAWWFLA